jgi:hypothetical protein
MSRAQFKTLKTLLSLHEKLEVCLDDENKIVIDFSNCQEKRSEIDISLAAVKAGLDASKVDQIYLEEAEKKISIPLAILDFRFFPSSKDFYHSVIETADPFGKDVAIWKFKKADQSESSLYYEKHAPDNFAAYFEEDENESTDFYLVENTLTYIKLFEFLESQQSPEGKNKFYFVDHFAWEDGNNGRAVFISSIKEGKLIIEFYKKPPDLDHSQNYSGNLIKLESAFSEANKNFPKFIKAVLFKHLLKTPDAQKGTELLTILPSIVEEAQQNFDAYLEDFSLDTFKAEYIGLKNKYLSPLREILGKIITQVVGLPIVFSTTLFATYELKSGWPILSIVAAVFVFYVVFAVYLLRMHSLEISDVQDNFNNEYETLKSDKFFSGGKHQEVLGVFTKIKSVTDARIQSLRRVLSIYFFSHGMINTFLLGLILSKIILDSKVLSLFTDPIMQYVVVLHIAIGFFILLLVIFYNKNSY